MSDALLGLGELADRLATAPIKEDWSASDNRAFDFVQIAFRVPDRDMIVSALRLAAQQDGAWQPIETAPKDGATLWLWYDNCACLGHYEPASWLGDGKWFIKGGVRKGGPYPDGVFSTHVVGAEPTLWCPLPPPPTS